MAADEEDKSPVAYLLVPDARALGQIESLWRRWQNDEPLDSTFRAGWRRAFEMLKDLRPWGVQDRVNPYDAAGLEEEIAALGQDELVRIEVELVFRKSQSEADHTEEKFLEAVAFHSGRVVSRSRIDEISYHGILLELPAREVQAIISRASESLAAFDSIMHIRPQSVASATELADASPAGHDEETGRLGAPILALLDGVPMARHPLLQRHVILEDMFGLEPGTQVTDRKHGTAMASLIVHGDRNIAQAALPRAIQVVPVMTALPGANESFPSDRLIVDLIYSAVRGMREGSEATAANVIIVNISLGNRRQPFYGRLSAWARLLDRLAYHYGILFIVSAGNVPEDFVVDSFGTRIAFEDADARSRSEGVLRAINQLIGGRKIIAPAESVNAITVGSCNEDAVPQGLRTTARSSVDPYGDVRMSNPSSALGPGYGTAVKPDLLMPGSRERLTVVRSDGHAISVGLAPPSRAAGLKVASPPRVGQDAYESYTNGTSAAAALASRTCHCLHDELERVYGNDFLALSHRQRAVLLKALLAHTAEWPEQTATLMREVLGPADNRQHVRQRDNVRRFLGYGLVDADSAIACVGDRATFWAVGEIRSGEMTHVPIPIPSAIAGRALPHFISATLAWFTPTHPGSKLYRSVRIRLLEPEELGELGLAACPHQPDVNQSNRGTLFNRRWIGNRAAAVSESMIMRLHVQREPDQVGLHDEPIPFGLAVSIGMPGVVDIYEQVRQRLGVQAQIPASA